MNKSQKNIENLKIGLTYEGKKRIDQLIKDIKKSISEANSENIKAMKYHLMSLDKEDVNNPINKLELSNQLKNLGTFLFDLGHVEYVKKCGKMKVSSTSHALKLFLTNYRAKYSIATYEV